MSDIILLKYWSRLNSKTQKELILKLRQQVASKELKSPASLPERVLK